MFLLICLASTTTSIPNPAPPRHLRPLILYGSYMCNCDYSFSYKYMHNYNDSYNFNYNHN